MVCGSCGRQIPDVARVCGYCGTPVVTAAAAPPGAVARSGRRRGHRLTWTIAFVLLGAVVGAGIVLAEGDGDDESGTTASSTSGAASSSTTRSGTLAALPEGAAPIPEELMRVFARPEAMAVVAYDPCHPGEVHPGWSASFLPGRGSTGYAVSGDPIIWVDGIVADQVVVVRLTWDASWVRLSLTTVRSGTEFSWGVHKGAWWETTVTDGDVHVRGEQLTSSDVGAAWIAVGLASPGGGIQFAAVLPDGGEVSAAQRTFALAIDEPWAFSVLAADGVAILEEFFVIGWTD